MRCIKCAADNTLKDRSGNLGRCKNCRHPFAFDPRAMTGVNFTDKFFQQSLASLSANGSLYFTPRQFYYFFNRRLNATRTDPLKAVGCLLTLGAAALAVYLLFSGGGVSLLWLILLLAAAFGVALLASRSLRRRLHDREHGRLAATPGEVEGWFDRWHKLNEDPVKRLPPPAPAPRGKPQPVQLNPEVMKYSFDRVVVCDRPEIAQCLIANNFHFEHNCAVLSLDGYPHDIFGAVMQMLRRNPELSVYALHDASPEGVGLAHRLRTESNWFAHTGANVYDLGLLPRQVFKRAVFVERKQRPEPLPPPVAATLEPAEVRWLEEGNSVALESFTPQTLLRVVAQGIAKSRDPQAADALAPVTTGDGGGVFIYTMDSFG